MFDLEEYPTVCRFVDGLTPEQEDRVLGATLSSGQLFARGRQCVAGAAYGVDGDWNSSHDSVYKAMAAFVGDNNWFIEFDRVLWLDKAGLTVKDRIQANRLIQDRLVREVAPQLAATETP